LLTFVALGWAVVAITICFFYAAGLWRDLFGRSGAFYAAVISLVICIMGSKLLLHVADKLVEPYSGPFDERAYTSAPRDAFYHNWPRYMSDIVRNRRYAFYARTGQWDKLAALEQSRRGEPAAELSPPSEGLFPRRTSMASELNPAEVYRGARRTSHRIAGGERWKVLDEYEF
jgi:hypothetical protein